jgi:hypothetical protein
VDNLFAYVQNFPPMKSYPGLKYFQGPSLWWGFLGNSLRNVARCSWLIGDSKYLMDETENEGLQIDIASIKRSPSVRSRNKSLGNLCHDTKMGVARYILFAFAQLCTGLLTSHSTWTDCSSCLQLHPEAESYSSGSVFLE